jgi:hypothetical protein
MTRPSSVPSDATEIFANGAGTPPGWDPQLAAVQQFERTIAHINAQAGFVYAGAYRDWKENDAQYTALGIQGPPAPRLVLRTANAVWADSQGNLHTIRQSGDVAWIWEV